MKTLQLLAAFLFVSLAVVLFTPIYLLLAWGMPGRPHSWRRRKC